MAMQAYMKIEGVVNSDRNTTTTIEIMSFSWGVGRAISSATGGGGAGKIDISEIHVTKQSDASSPKLLAACVNGQHFGSAEIGVLLPAVQSANAQPEYLKYEFKNVIISEFEAGGNFGGSPLPVETIKFEFAQVAILLPAVQ